MKISRSNSNRLIIENKNKMFLNMQRINFISLIICFNNVPIDARR